MYSDVNPSSKQLYTCMEVQVRQYQVIQGGKSGTLVICGVGVKRCDFTRATTTCARLQPLSKTENCTACYHSAGKDEVETQAG